MLKKILLIVIFYLKVAYLYPNPDSIEYYSYIDTLKCKNLINENYADKKEADLIYILKTFNYYIPRKIKEPLEGKINQLEVFSQKLKEKYKYEILLTKIWYYSFIDDKKQHLLLFKKILNDNKAPTRIKIRAMNILSYKYAFESTHFASKLLTTALVLGLKDSLPELYHTYLNYCALNISFNLTSEARNAFKNGSKFKKKNNNPVLEKLYLHNKGVFFMIDDKLDSALIYFLNVYNFFKKYDFPEYLIGALINASRMYFYMGKIDSAYYLSVSSYKMIENRENMYSGNSLSRFYWILSDIYEKRKQIDSSIFFIKKALRMSIITNLTDAIAEQYLDLSNSYWIINQKDSAYFYLKEAFKKKSEFSTKINLSFAVENNKKIQFLESALKLKDYELSLEKSKKKIENLQINLYISIFSFLMIIVLIIIIIRNRYLLKISKMRDSFSKELINNYEHTIQTISNNLHDHIGHQLLILGRSEMILNNEELKNKLNIVIEEIRETSHNLYPRHLLQFSFNNAIKELIHQVEKTTHFTVIETISDEVNSLSKENKMHLYRICQELINNSIKYCDGNLIKIDILKDKQYYILKYQDKSNFCKHKNIKPGFGLNNIMIRSKMLNGKISYYYDNGFHFKLKFYLA